MGTTGKAIASTYAADGTLTVALIDQDLPDPTGHEVLVRVEAAPINPSDLLALFGPFDFATADYTPGKVVGRFDRPAPPPFVKRMGHPMPGGNEGAGTVIAAGDAPEAQALLGKVVTGLQGGMYAEYRLLDARACMPLPDGIDAATGASSFVNPMTALTFVETMRKEGFTGLIHTAAASNLGQILVKICREDGVPLVNIVRKEEQAALLRSIGAEHICNSSAPDFHEQLVAAIKATGAMLAFDAVGGGDLAGRILTAMEEVAAIDAPYDPYGTHVRKKVCIYGILDRGPTVFEREIGFTWELSGYILTDFLAQNPPEWIASAYARVAAGLTTTFASHYTARVPLARMLDRDVLAAYAQMRTGEKVLIVPHG
ncbi:putative oxidoreductase [Caenibius tardaugens NBRC 16725]|uniref:Putative oxidoreductase n=1 Tax=Caenibius tardaugens NBRC 16725 TaxID=1219035 RepID=U2YJ12_9SPHN|nr:zinc-binding dehydrogenase [Caenibius tardaugens]AZI34648.1 NADH oxidase [Caenibius tardaugens NBRC 16725]GAD48157.1 putative oxidoreductase [Caenibius tardaugens NBRC 16725]